MPAFMYGDIVACLTLHSKLYTLHSKYRASE